MTLTIMQQLKHFNGRTIWWYSTSLLMNSWCSTPFFIVSLSNWSKYFLTAFDFILAITNVFGFSPAETNWHTSWRVGTFLYSSTIFSGVTCWKMKTAFKVLTISSSSSSSMIGSTTQLMFYASCLRSSGIFVLLRHISMVSQTDECEITLTSSLSAWLSLVLSHEGLKGQWLSASAALLEQPVWYMMTKLNNARSLSHQICDASNFAF